LHLADADVSFSFSFLIGTVQRAEEAEEDCKDGLVANLKHTPIEFDRTYRIRYPFTYVNFFSTHSTRVRLELFC
jgi:hypothetical protein